MNEEASHIAQWHELKSRAENFGLRVSFDSEAFYLWPNLSQRDPIGRYESLADLRAGISDFIAGERAAGRIYRYEGK